MGGDGRRIQRHESRATGLSQVRPQAGHARQARQDRCHGPEPGTVNLGNNWVSPNAAAFWIGHVTGTKLNGWASNLGTGNQPGFANAALHGWLPGAG